MDDNKTNNIGNIVSVITPNNNILIKGSQNLYGTAFYYNNFYDERETTKFIKSIERMVRTSREYNIYIESIRNHIAALDHDSILSNITTADVNLEFHHYPISLYDIIDIIITHDIAINKKVNSFEIAKEIMDLHYANEIGVVSLTVTNHELAHTGDIFISTKEVFGDYKKFMEDYKDGLSSDIIMKVKHIEELSNNNNPSDFRGLYNVIC